MRSRLRCDEYDLVCRQERLDLAWRAVIVLMAIAVIAQLVSLVALLWRTFS